VFTVASGGKHYLELVYQGLGHVLFEHHTDSEVEKVVLILLSKLQVPSYVHPLYYNPFLKMLKNDLILIVNNSFNSTS